MRTYEIYSIENNLASLQTTVRFRVWQTLVTMDRLIDECKVTLDGRYDLDDTGLLDAVENVYEQEITNV